MKNLKLYHYWRSSSSWRVRWALEHKELEFQPVHINLLEKENQSQEHLKRNPMGAVPVLEFKNDKGETRFLTESMAIVLLLEEIFPKNPLFPQDPYSRAQVIRLCEMINSGVQPVQNLRVQVKLSDDPEERKKWAEYWNRQGLEAYSQAIRSTAGKFSFGDEVTAADLFLIPQIYNANRFGVEIKKEFPLLAQIDQNARSTKACEKASPDAYAPQS